MNSATSSAPSLSGPWWRELTGYHWFVFLLAAFGWMFDCFDQQIFTMSRSITMRDLMPVADTLTQINTAVGARPLLFFAGARGGVFFARRAAAGGAPRRRGWRSRVFSPPRA